MYCGYITTVHLKMKPCQMNLCVFHSIHLKDHSENITGRWRLFNFCWQNLQSAHFSEDLQKLVAPL